MVPSIGSALTVGAKTRTMSPGFKPEISLAKSGFCQTSNKAMNKIDFKRLFMSSLLRSFEINFNSHKRYSRFQFVIQTAADIAAYGGPSIPVDTSS
jgi:hypothetical protein